MAGGCLAVIFAVGLASIFLPHKIAVDAGSVSFGYAGNSPANWGRISPDYKTCSTGTRQSPIDINSNNASINTKLRELDWLYLDVNATLINKLFTVMLRFDQDAGFLSQDGKNYTLKQLHWHTPSEHTIDKQRFPLELHLVHKSDDGNFSVIGVLYDFGNPDPFIYQLKDAVSKLAKEHNSGGKRTHLHVGRVRTNTLKHRTRKFFKYSGSFTTPPCTEIVTWYILGKVRHVSREQVALLRSPLSKEFKENARPTQPLNGRVVQLYDESKFDPHPY